MKSKIIIIGTGGHAVSIANVAMSNEYTVLGLADDNKVGESIVGIPVISAQKCELDYSSALYAIAIGDNSTRQKVAMSFKNKIPNAQFPSLIHNSAVIGVNSVIGNGTVIMPQANIGPNSVIGDFCIINSASSLDHDCHLGDFASLAPKVATGGNVTIGNGSAISIGAIIKHNVKIGRDTVIGAASYVNRDIEDGKVAYGTPCKQVRSRRPQDPYLS